jgi:hypothetical protein
VDDNIIYTPDQLNTFFATPHTVRPSNTDFDSAYDSPTEEFAFINTFELEVHNAIHQIRSNAIGADGVPIKFLKSSFLTYYRSSPTPLIPSLCHPASQRRRNYQKLCQWPRPTILVVPRICRLIIILPALSKAMEIIMRNQITAHIERNVMMSRLQSGFRSHHSLFKNNECPAFGFRGETDIYTRTTGILESFRQC